jgi:hypothetical protein
MNYASGCLCNAGTMTQRWNCKRTYYHWWTEGPSPSMLLFDQPIVCGVSTLLAHTPPTLSRDIAQCVNTIWLVLRVLGSNIHHLMMS